MEREVRRYIEDAKDDPRKVYDRLEKIILGLHPNAQVTISYKIVKYKTAGGEVWLGYWKEGVSIHAVDAAAYQAAHPEVKIGRGSINFRIRDKIDAALLKRIIKRSMERTPKD